MNEEYSSSQKLMKAIIALDFLSENVKRNKFIDLIIKENILKDITRIHNMLININIKD